MENLLTLAALTFLLTMIPGPNIALIVANSLKHGTRFGLITVAGTTMGVAIQLALVVFGLSAILGLLTNALVWIKWIGVVYLIFLGVKTWREPTSDLSNIKAQREHSRALFWRGVGVAVVNPKTLVLNAAFLPQFVSPESTGPTQLIILASVFLTVLAFGDSLWAIFAGYTRTYIARYSHLVNRLSGGFLMAAGAGLALTHND